MEKEFVPYELAVKLKELGFNESQLGFSYMKFQCEGTPNAYIERVVPNYLYNAHGLLCTAPLWQQAFDWFRESHKLVGSISLSRYKDKYSSETYGYHISNYNYVAITYNHYETYQEARKACLEKLIELISK
jgi:hypothetical protein